MQNTLYDQLFAAWPESQQQPFRLTCSEISDPYQVLSAFFNWYTLPHFRLCLKEWLIDALRADDVEALEYVLLHDNIEKLVEAVWVVVQDKENQHKNPFTAPVVSLTSEKELQDADPLERIIDIIVKTTQPEKVFLLDAHDNDNTGRATHYDLLALLPGKSSLSFNEYQTMVETACQPIADVLVSFSKATETYRLIKEGHIFFSLACTTENLVYDNGRIPLPIPDITDLTDIKVKAQDTFYKSFRIARLFLDGAGYFQCQQARDLSAFMLQQAAEHSLRALLYALTGHNYVTHNLLRLLRYTRRCVPDLDNTASNTEEDKHLINLLYKAYVHARYKGDYHIEENELQVLFTLVRQWHQKAEQMFLEKIDSLTFNAPQHG